MSADPFQVGPLPPGVAPPTTRNDQALYTSALGFEGVFTQHMVDDMMQSAQGPDSSDGDAGSPVYQEMENQALNQALMNGGGLGLAGALYAQLRGTS